MYYVYILKSLSNNRHYVGYTIDLYRRLEEHNRGKTRSTKYVGPYELMYKEKYNTELEAIRRERQIKSYKGGKAFKKLLSQSMSPSSSLV